MTIDILMATYNGAKYIESQILSLIAQTHKDWRLLIHDDASTDNTVEIIKKYEDFDDRIEIIFDGVKCGGAAQNFLHLLKYSTADYIIFCDQDDIWFESKLDVLITILSTKQLLESKPQALFAGGYLYNSSQGIIGEIPSLQPRNLEDILFLSGGVQGCSLLFDKHIRQIVNCYDEYTVMHDHLLTLALTCFGEINYIDSRLMLYRQQHVGKVTASIEVYRLKRILNMFSNKFPVIDKSCYNANLAFYTFFIDKLDSHQIYLFEQYFLFYKTKSLLKRLYIIIHNNFNIGNSVLSLCIKIILRPLRN